MKPIQSATLAYTLMVNQFYLSNQNVKDLFGVTSSATVARIKRPVLQAMAEKGVASMDGFIHIATAYEVWGLDRQDLENRYSKAVKHGLPL